MNKGRKRHIVRMKITEEEKKLMCKRKKQETLSLSSRSVLRSTYLKTNHHKMLKVTTLTTSNLQQFLLKLFQLNHRCPDDRSFEETNDRRGAD